MSIESSNAVVYKRVLVLGSKRVGKSSLLGAALNGDLAQDNMYNPTLRVERFYDVERKLQFIDTPGLDDQILSPDLLDFTKDPVVQEFLDTIEQDKKEILKDVAIEELSAYLIVHNSDEITKKMAETLWKAINAKLVKTSRSRKSSTTKIPPIFFVLNEFHKSPGSQILRKKNKIKAERDSDADNKHSSETETASKRMEEKVDQKSKTWKDGFGLHFRVNAKTFANLDFMLDQVSNILESRVDIFECLPRESQNTFKQGNGDRRAVCTAPGCSIS